MKKYKTISNKFGNTNLYICQINDLEYIIGIPEKLKDNAEMVVEIYNSCAREKDKYSIIIKFPEVLGKPAPTS